jgi:hypothetical protein
VTKNGSEKPILPKIVRTWVGQDLWPEMIAPPGEAAELLAGGVQQSCLNGGTNRQERALSHEKGHPQVDPKAYISLLLDLFESLNQVLS